MGSNCGVWLAKYLLCLFNFLFFVIGTIVLGTGTWLAVDKASLIALLKMVENEHINQFTQPRVIEQMAYVLIAIGGLMFFMSFLGYCGAIRESRCLLTTYGIFMIMLLIAEFVAGGLAAFYKDKDLVSRQNLQQHTKTICRYSNFSFYLNISAITFLVTIPILTSYGNLVMEVDIPGINVHKSPIYEIVYAFEAFFEAPIAALTYMAHVNMFLIFASIGTFMMKELQTKLNNLSDLNNIEAEVMINNCIKTHITIIKYAEDLEAMFTFVNFVDVFLFCFAICLMLVYSSMDFSAALMLKGLQPMFLQAALLFLLFRFGHDFSDESLNVAHAAYNTDWINRSLQFQKSILFIITRSQKPLQLTVAGFKPLTMEVFVSILRISYSFFSVLQSSL